MLFVGMAKASNIKAVNIKMSLSISKLAKGLTCLNIIQKQLTGLKTSPC